MRYRAFIGDLHGSLKALNSALSKIDLKDTDVYFLGDYVDRGKHSFSVLEKLKELSENPNYSVQCILGNHDKMFLDFVYFGDSLGMLNDTSLNTFKSFLNRPMTFDGRYDICDENYQKITKEVREYLLKHPLTLWLQSLPYYLETTEQIIVHAGVDKALNDWKETTPEDMIWLRPQLFLPNKTGKDIIVGHTMTYRFFPDMTEQPPIYINQNTEFFIDTANYYFGNARVLLYDVLDKTYSCID